MVAESIHPDIQQFLANVSIQHGQFVLSETFKPVPENGVLTCILETIPCKFPFKEFTCQAIKIIRADKMGRVLDVFKTFPHGAIFELDRSDCSEATKVMLARLAQEPNVTSVILVIPA